MAYTRSRLASLPPRFYEELSSSLITIPFLGKLKDENLQNLSPLTRIYSTSFSQPTNEFKGTLLSCLDLVYYCDAADKTKPYNEWRGRLDGNEETNTLRFISEICAGFYVKLNTNSKPIKDKTSYAVLYAFRPWSSHFGEPKLAVKEMKDGKMIEDAPLKNIKADQIVAICGPTNSLCEAVVAWLQTNMGACFDGIRTTVPLASGATDVARALEESLGILGTATLRERYVTNMRAHMEKL